MDIKRLKTILLILIAAFCFVNKSSAQTVKEHIQVSMRMIGHQLLLNAGDSTSRVLPIENEGSKFRIRFQSEFGFLPSEFVTTIDSIIEATKLAKDYRVEVEDTKTNKIVYSYEVDSAYNNVIPCGPRTQAKGKYDVLITIIESYDLATGLTMSESSEQLSTKTIVLGVVLGTLSILLLVGFYLWSRKTSRKNKSNLVQIGKYRFDERNMKLLLKKESIDLTSKEADLIALLHSSVNVTLERDVILKAVWEDEGDYVGRTLDVFISKLRKKFAADEDVKIVNVRGVGYKLLLDMSNTNNSWIKTKGA